MTKTKINIPCVTIITTLVLMAGVFYPSRGQAFAPTFGSYPVCDQSGRSAGSILENEMPGITNTWSPLIFPPIFRADTKVRLVFTEFYGKVENKDTGVSSDLVHDLRYVSQGINWELMSRVQVSRIGLRGHYDAYMRTYRSRAGRFDWPNVRFGADLELVLTRSTRFGVDLDFYPDRPRFSSDVGPLGLVELETPRASSVGIHLAYNSPECGTLGWSFEGRARHDFRNSRTGLRELDLALGIKSPETALGTLSLRGGWRYTNIIMITNSIEANIHWSAIFGELIYFF